MIPQRYRSIPFYLPFHNATAILDFSYITESGKQSYKPAHANAYLVTHAYLIESRKPKDNPLEADDNRVS